MVVLRQGFLETRNSTDVFVYKTTSKRQQGMSILALLDLEKSYEWCGHPRQTDHLFHVQQPFCFLAVSRIDEMYVYVCNVDANIFLNKKNLYILGPTNFKFLSRIKRNSINIIVLKFIFSIGGSYGDYSPRAPKTLVMQLQSLFLLLFLFAQASI